MNKQDPNDKSQQGVDHGTWRGRPNDDYKRGPDFGKGQDYGKDYGQGGDQNARSEGERAYGKRSSGQGDTEEGAAETNSEKTAQRDYERSLARGTDKSDE